MPTYLHPHREAERRDAQTVVPVVGSAVRKGTELGERLECPHAARVHDLVGQGQQPEQEADTLGRYRGSGPYQEDSHNGWTWCTEAGRWYAATKAPHTLPKLDALEEYRTSPLFSTVEYAALQFASELTEHKKVSPDTFAQLTYHHSEREICEIVRLVSSSYLYNMNQLGLGTGSDGFWEPNPQGTAQHRRPKAIPGHP